MYTALLPGALGVRASLAEGLELARRHGFTGYHFDIREAADLGAERVRILAEETEVRPAAFGFPLEFRRDEVAYQEGLADLPRLAAVAAELGVTRTSTWIMPVSSELTYRQNFALHAARLAPAADVLADHGVRLGLEYVGPKTLWSSGRFPFIHTLREMTELCDAVGPNAGYLLDSFHWFTAHERAETLRELSKDQIVEVHVNDAPDGPRDEQIDQQRTLPGATGVIDLNTFLRALQGLGYDGPVLVEPFSEAVRALPADEACAATAASLQAVWRAAGL